MYEGLHRRGIGGALPLLVAATLYLVLALMQTGRPLTYDEVDFAKAARAIAAGSFQYDRGYIVDYPWNPDSGQRLQYALFHPPGYLLLLAGWQRLFGDADATLRTFGVVCGLATLVATVTLARFAGGASAAILAAFLWATSPYAVQSSLLLDIDGTVLAPAVAVLGWLALRRAFDDGALEHRSNATAGIEATERVAARGQSEGAKDMEPAPTPSEARGRERKGGVRRDHEVHAYLTDAVGARAWLQWSSLPAAVIAVSFAGALWLKLTTPVVVAVLLAGWLVVTGQRAAALRLAGTCSAGAIVFGATWLAFATALGLPPERPFIDLAYEVLDSFGLVGAPTEEGAGLPVAPLAATFPLPLRALVAGLRALQWLHPLFVGLLVAAPMALRWREPGAALLVVAAGVMALYLVKLAGGFPKYHAGVLPLACVVAGVVLTRWIGPARPAVAALTGGGVVASMVVAALTGADALIREADLRLLAAWVAAGAACLALALPFGAARAAALAAGLLLGANLSTAVYQAVQGTAGWSASYFYGSAGQVEAGTWLRATVAPGEIVVADREVAYYASAVHFVDTERLLAPGAAAGASLWLPGVPGTPRVIVSRHAWIAGALPAGAGVARVVATFGEYRALVIETPS